MSHIRSKNTKPELKVRQWLWQHGYRYRLNVKGVPGKPDIVMRKYRTALFVNGCFWHGHNVETCHGEPAEELPHFQTTGFKRATFWAGLTGLRTFFLALPVRSRQR